MISSDESDGWVLAFLRREGPGTVTVRRIAEKTGVPRVTVRASVAVLAVDRLICLIANVDETAYMIQHLHAEKSDLPCEEPFGCTIQEDGAS
jgi:predicted transcriptional regulator of viral defense system